MMHDPNNASNPQVSSGGFGLRNSDQCNYVPGQPCLPDVGPFGPDGNPGTEGEGDGSDSFDSSEGFDSSDSFGGFDDEERPVEQPQSTGSDIPTHIEGFGRPMARFQKRTKSKVIDPDNPSGPIQYASFNDPKVQSTNRSGDNRFPYGRNTHRNNTEGRRFGYSNNYGNGNHSEYNNQEYNNPSDYDNRQSYDNRQNTSNRDYGNRDYGNRDYSNRDYSNRDYGNRDYGNRDYGNRDYGNRDYGNRDYGNRDYGNRQNYGNRPDYRTGYRDRRSNYNNGYNNNSSGGHNNSGYNNGGYRPNYNRTYTPGARPPYESDDKFTRSEGYVPQNRVWNLPPNLERAERPPLPYEVNPNNVDPELLKDEIINLEVEPLSIAEELAEEINHGKPPEDEFDKIYKQLREENSTNLADLQKLSMTELIEAARQENLAEVDIETAQRQDLIFRILKERVKLNGLMYGEGTLEILPDGFGFLRSADYHYVSCPDDIYVSPSQIRRFGLKNGVTISGQIRPPKENERYFALLRVEAINYREPNELIKRKSFDDLTPIHPNQRIVMETTPDEIDTRVTDLMVPLGFGQRGLIVSPPRAGKTILLQKMAKAALQNYPDLYVFMLLIDERPEEVTDMERQIKGPNCEVISSTFDENTTRHIQLSEIVLEKAKRMVEYGRDVLIFLDSITRLARAYNTECPLGGKIMTGGVDANALQNPKRFFGAARRVEEGGSLTIVATALIDTGSRMDSVIFEEFKGTGNLEIVLDRALVDKRIWPAIDLNASGTRREERLMDPETYQKICSLRRELAEQQPCDAMESLVEKLSRTKTNEDFLNWIR